jgi:hypothetical protein
MKEIISILFVASAIGLLLGYCDSWAADTQQLLTGARAFGDWHDDTPSVRW